MTTSSARASAWWLYGFLLFQFVCQAALMAPLGSARIGFRAATFLSSLALLVLLPPKGRPYPLQFLVIGIIGITSLGLFHPHLNTLGSGLGQIGLTLSIWAPVFWVPRIHITRDVFRRVLLLVWGFNVLSAGVGVLQVYDPDRFAPDPVFVQQLLGEAASGLLVTLDNGTRIYRPMGLSDSPGGAATAGSFAILIGMGIVWLFSNPLIRLATVPAAAVGVFCLFLCQVRATLVITGISLLGIIAIMAIRGRTVRAAYLAIAAGAVALGGFFWATMIGSEAVISRFSTLTEDSAINTYYSHRGFFLEYTFTEDLPNYPLGAGLGRYGMMAAYFGDPLNANSPPLHAEIQATGWVFDGGLPLLLAGYAALAGALVLPLTLAFSARSQAIADMAAVVVALDVGLIAATFGYALFVSQTGMFFWVLNTALFVAATEPATDTLADRGNRRAT